jgi:hypothetical protein
MKDSVLHMLHVHTKFHGNLSFIMGTCIDFQVHTLPSIGVYIFVRTDVD